MIDILATYREEKNNAKLIELPDGFFDMAKDYLGSLQAETSDTDFEEELRSQDINSSSRALEMLSDLRLKKILKGAIADAYRKEPVHGKDHFTSKELKLYVDIVKGIKEIKGTHS